LAASTASNHGIYSCSINTHVHVLLQQCLAFQCLTGSYRQDFGLYYVIVLLLLWLFSFFSIMFGDVGYSFLKVHCSSRKRKFTLRKQTSSCIA